LSHDFYFLVAFGFCAEFTIAAAENSVALRLLSFADERFAKLQGILQNPAITPGKIEDIT
jgi:hypothetical protein